MITRDSDGKRLKGEMPVHMLKLFSTYAPLSVPGLTAGGGIVWQSKVYNPWVDESLRPIYTQKAYSVVNLMARYAVNRHWSVTANLNNLFDQRYRTYYQSVHVYGAPRNLYVTAKYQF